MLADLEWGSWHISHESDGFFMYSPDFAACANAQDVWSVAEAHTASLSMLAMLLDRDASSLGVAHVIESFPDSTHKAFYLETSGVVSIRSETFTATDKPPILDGVQVSRTLATLEGDPVYLEISHLLTPNEHMWAINAWKIYELVRSDIGDRTGKPASRALGEHGLRWITDNEFKRFRRTTNSPTVSGPAARHAKLDGDDDSIVPMSRQEVGGFIHKLVKQWARWRYDIPKES